MKKPNKLKEKMTLHPIMTFIILIIGTMLLSGILSFLEFGSTYSKINSTTLAVEEVEVTITSLFSLSGVKYIFSNTVSNFMNFAPLSMLIIILIGIGIMEKSGFLKMFFTIITKYSSKYKVTFFLILASIIASIGGDVTYVVIPILGALLFKYGKRNPLVGVIASFAGLTCGSGLSVFITSIDSNLINYTKDAAHLLDKAYNINVYSFIIIMAVAIIILAFALTSVTEKFIIPKMEKYQFPEDDNFVISKRELRGLVIALLAGIAYLLFFIYNIIPGLPLSGNLLDYSEIRYIDKLFGYNSFFNSGFVFVVTIFFIILGLCYGLGAKTIKNSKDMCNCFGHSLDGTGNTLVLILFASIFISVFKKTNIGMAVCAYLINMISSLNLSGLVLVLALFIITMLVTFLLPSSIYKWSVLSALIVPTFMNSGLSPEFSQVIFRLGESVTTSLTPLAAYYVIYLAYLERFNQNPKPITITKSLKYMAPYSLVTFVIFISILILWYFSGLPFGIGSYPFL